MQKRYLTAIGLSLAILVGPAATANAATAPSSDASPTQTAGALVLVGTTTSDQDLAGDLLGASKCSPGSKTKHAHTTYEDALGNPAFTIYHTISYSYNCTKVTSLSSSASVVSYSPLYRFGGWIAHATSGIGTPTAYAIAQARVGICPGVAVDGCVMESDPFLNWVVNARGGASVHGGGGGA